MKTAYVSHITTENTGGGCMVDFIHLTDGRVLTLGDEAVGLYPSKDAFYAASGGDDVCTAFMWIPKKGKQEMENVTYDFIEGQLVELFHGVPQDAWTIYKTPDNVLRRALEWNEPNGDFDGLERSILLEIFLHDFIVSRKK